MGIQRCYGDILNSDLFAGVVGNPNFENAVSKDFSILEGPTRITRGL